MRNFEVIPGEQSRLDLFVGRKVGGSRRYVTQLIDDGRVRLNGRRTRKGANVQIGDIVSVEEPELPMLLPNAELAVTVLYEDAAMIAVDKPAGMPTHALRGDDRNTVANFLVAYDSNVLHAGRIVLEGGVVHRLDNDTSGILLAAKSPEAYRELREQFRQQKIRKEYAAIVPGVIRGPRTIDLAIAHAGKSAARMHIVTGKWTVPDARPAVTEILSSRQSGKFTLVTLRIETGVRHQIRVHLASIGNPIVGDQLYCTPTFQATSRLMLHATRLCVESPATKCTVTIESPLPDEMSAFLEDAGTRR